jgi:tetratricopeptide (TPR) repeat protein
MRAAILTVLLAICLATTLRAADEADTTFARANADYTAGKYTSAIEGYESLVKNGHWNASVFYDLGNAYFRKNDLGRAILNYERALALDPAQPEARANLQLVRDRARALELRTGWAEQHLDFLTRDQYTWLAAIAFWGAVAIGMGLNFSKRRPVVWTFTLVLLGAIAAGAAAAAYQLENGSAGRNLAIVVDKDVSARLAATESVGTVLILPPGSEIKILSTRGSWDYAALPNDQLGWIPHGSAERVRL